MSSRQLAAAAAPGVVALVVALVALLDPFADDRPAGEAPRRAAPPADAPGLAELFDRVDGVVARVDARRAPSDPPFGNGRRVATGAGFLIDRRGHLVTNAHVVQGARTVALRFGRSARRVPARIVGRDDATDLAVLRVDPGRVRGERPLPLALPRRVRVGDPVLAVGTPYRLQGSASAGIVSAVGREIRGLTGFTIPDAVQTDAAVNPGNSGGPLVDAAGAVVGVNAQGRGPGVSFAIGAATVRRVVPQLIEDGRAEASFLGVGLGDVTARGTRLGSVTTGGPADRAGLRAGDLITRFAGRTTAADGALTSAIAATAPGADVRIAFVRAGVARDVTLTTGRQPRRAR